MYLFYKERPMRKLLLGLMCFLPFSVFAETKPIDKIEPTLLCYNTSELFKTLRIDYLESPLLLGETDDDAQSTMSLWTSKKGASWTLVATRNEVSCVVGTGKNLKVIRQVNRV